MKKLQDGRRRFSREFKIAAVRRVQEGESVAAVAEDLEIAYQHVWRWHKRALVKGADQLYEVGQAGQWMAKRPRKARDVEGSQQRRIAELERLVGRQQMEIDFLDKALRRVEELRQQKKDAGGGASSKR